MNHYEDFGLVACGSGGDLFIFMDRSTTLCADTEACFHLFWRTRVTQNGKALCPVS